MHSAPGVRKEVREFKELGRTDRILAVMIAGEPNADDPAKVRTGVLPDEECFCEELRFGVAKTDGAIDWTARTEPLAADLRPGGMRAEGFVSADAYREHLTLHSALPPEKIAAYTEAYRARLELGLLKIVAGLLGVPLSQLTERDAAYRAEVARQELARAEAEAHRLRNFNRRLAASAIVIFLLGLIAGWFWWQSNIERKRASVGEVIATQQKNRAETAELLARRRADEIRQAAAETLSSVFSFAHEKERLLVAKTLYPHILSASLDSPKVLAETVLRFKGAVLDSILEDRFGFSGAVDQGNHVSTMGGTSSTRRALNVSVEDVQRRLGKSSALVEFIEYPTALPSVAADLSYGAVVLTASGEPKWIPLGKTADIDREIGVYRRFLRGGSGISDLQNDEATLRKVKGVIPNPRENEAALRKVLNDLDRSLIEPVRAVLPKDIHRLILSLDGSLHKVSFSILLNKSDKFLIEDFEICYMASGRDLLRDAAATSGEAVIFANADFGGNKPSEFTKYWIPSLPGTGMEAQLLNKLFQQRGLPTRIFTGKEASEKTLRTIKSPRILHIATGGGDFPKNGVPGVANSIPFLALAGANSVFGNERLAKVPNGEDGILLPEEVVALDLRNTWLVTLSTCGSENPAIQVGEGVFGMQRSFSIAGALNVLVALSLISDEETIRFMTDFYEEALRTSNPAQALRQVQRQRLAKLRSEFGLLQAVKSTGPFILICQGPPSD